ncbi:MAG: cation:proton antiporter subunit C [Candidatus Methanofastidiosa archaeon]|nr:cation:proton antiporter subunit C [Candidatus Methanofastidiosa archaeon]
MSADAVQLWSFVTAGFLIIVGLYAIILMDNMVKKIIGMMLIGDGVNLVLITEGFRPGAIVPIISEKLYDLGVNGLYQEFASEASNSLPYALVLTNIVIGASTLAVLLGISIKLYQRYHTLSVNEIFKEDSE